MFQHLFATMNEMLDEVLVHYPKAQGGAKQDLQQKISLLKSMSDGIVEEWLRFEEKMGALRESQSEQANVTVLPESHSEAFQRGQGYYKLCMYDLSAEAFEQVIRQYPDSLVGRIYLAMAYLQLNEFNDAYRHFQFIIPLTESKKLKAISYNALGCIQAQNQNIEKAQEYFNYAHQADPTFQEPLTNLKLCESTEYEGAYQYGSELTSFM